MSDMNDMSILLDTDHLPTSGNCTFLSHLKILYRSLVTRPGSWWDTWSTSRPGDVTKQWFRSTSFNFDRGWPVSWQNSDPSDFMFNRVPDSPETVHICKWILI